MGRSWPLPGPALALDRLRLHAELRDLLRVGRVRHSRLRQRARLQRTRPGWGGGALLRDGRGSLRCSRNTVWLLVLGGHGGSIGPPFATTCASFKFLLIGIAIVYALWGLAVRFSGRRRRAR